MAFVDYKKVFDSVEYWAIMKVKASTRIDHHYRDLMGNIYSHKTNTFFIITGTVSQQLFNLVLKGIFKKLNWSNPGININGEKMNHLRVINDVVLFVDCNIDLKDMLTTKTVGLKMNMTSSPSTISCRDFLLSYFPYTNLRH